jgi:hypothetical protein
MALSPGFAHRPLQLRHRGEPPTQQLMHGTLDAPLTSDGAKVEQRS